MARLLAYWDMRGVAQPIRYLLHYKGVEFKDKRYENMEDWMKEKFNLNLDFPNLPYFIDGHLRLTQSLTILRHLARTYNLVGSNQDETARIELAEQQLIDLRTNFSRTTYSPEYEKIKDEFIQGIPAQFKMWSDFLGSHKFLVGDKITYVDFIAYDVFDFYEMFIPTVFKGFSNIKQYLKRIENLPQLQSHFKSSTYKKGPIFGSFGYLGGTGEEPEKE